MVHDVRKHHERRPVHRACHGEFVQDHGNGYRGFNEDGYGNRDG